MSISNYETEDIYLTAYLVSSGICQLIRIEDSDGWKKKFILHPPPRAEEIDCFYNGTGRVPALELCSRLRSLKAAVKVRGL